MIRIEQQGRWIIYRKKWWQLRWRNTGISRTNLTDTVRLARESWPEETIKVLTD